MNTWILAANGSCARLFKVATTGGLEEIEDFTNPANRQHERDLTSDRYGRAMSSASGHSESYQEPSVRQREQESFARELGERLEKALRNHEFDSLYLVCGPRFIGLLRKHLHPSVVSAVKLEVHKNLATHPLQEIRAHLPERL